MLCPQKNEALRRQFPHQPEAGYFGVRTFKSNHADNYPLVLKSEQTGVKTHVSATCQHLQWAVPAFLVIPYPHGAFPGGP